jgi:hypothetical protein
MRRSLAIMGLVAVGTAAATAPAVAFWPRSQWLACSEAQTAADYRRWRCWELDGYGGAIMPGHGLEADPLAVRPRPRRSIRRGDAVRRLG